MSKDEKDVRLVLRVSKDLLAWLTEQGLAREMRPAAYARLRLAEMRAGLDVAAEKADFPPASFGRNINLPSERERYIGTIPEPDGVHIDIPSMAPGEPALLPGGLHLFEGDALPPAIPFQGMTIRQPESQLDLDAMVDNALQAAESQGLTRPIEDTYDVQDTGVRLLQEHKRSIGKEWGVRT